MAHRHLLQLHHDTPPRTKKAMERLRARRIVATVAPYPSALLRFTPGIINSVEEVERGLAAVRELATH